MLSSRFLSSFLLILTILSLIIPSPGFTVQESSFQKKPAEELPWESLQNGHLITYDSVMHILQKIENEDFEITCTLQELEKVSQFIALLGRQGVIPGETDTRQLEKDIAKMQNPQPNPYEYSYDFYYEDEYEIIPSLYYYSNTSQTILCKSFFKKIKHFVKKHKKAIIIGAAVVVAAVAVVGIAAAVSAGAGAAAGAGSAEDTNKHKKDESQKNAPVEPTPDNTPSDELPSSFQEEVSTLKDLASQQGFIHANDFNFPEEETGRILGQVLTHQSLDAINPSPFSYHLIADKVFHPNDGTRFDLIDTAQTDPVIDIHQLRGERAMELHYYDQAIFDFGKIIEYDPCNQEAYLERASAHFYKGNYQSSLEDYNTYIAHKGPAPTQAINFSLGFAKGLACGASESGMQLVSFAAEILSHPIDTGRSICEACSILCELARSEEWETIGQAFSPEMHELITKWEILSSEQRGELAGKAFGKVGSDIVLPGACGKLAASLGTGAKQALTAIKTIKNAEKTLALEALAQSACDSQHFAKTTTYLRATEKAALSSEEISILPKVERQLSQQEKIASLKKMTHAEDFLRPYQKSYLSEAEARALIQRVDIQTFPRPAGIPENFKIQLTDKGAGMEYMHPTNTHISVRVMPGKPHSPNPSQQNPYVIQKKNGKAFDKYGNLVDQKSPEAHIPIEEFIYRN